VNTITGTSTAMLRRDQDALYSCRSREFRERLIRQQQLLEDSLFRRMQPLEYDRVLRYVERHGLLRRDVLDDMVARIEIGLSINGIIHVESRIKHLYSIHCKEKRTGKHVSEFFDLLGIRLICEDRHRCYAVASYLHSLYPYVPHRYKDYIASPKRNGYRSIHTSVIGPDDTLVECQIRTVEMHVLSEATHGHYKQKDMENGSN
jgi:(p)ppGpp synthase/HD superfamily hydrolase